MNQEIKKLWLEALRSGDYKQARGTLRRQYGDNPHHCCLGVLCEIVVKNNTASLIYNASPNTSIEHSRLYCRILSPNIADLNAVAIQTISNTLSNSKVALTK